MNTIQLPSLNKTISIAPEQISDFHKNGQINTKKRKLEERDTYGQAFLQIMNLLEVDEEVRKFTLAKRFAKIAADYWC